MGSSARPEGFAWGRGRRRRRLGRRVWRAMGRTMVMGLMLVRVLVMMLVMMLVRVLVMMLVMVLVRVLVVRLVVVLARVLVVRLVMVLVRVLVVVLVMRRLIGRGRFGSVMVRVGWTAMGRRLAHNYDLCLLLLNDGGTKGLEPAISRVTGRRVIPLRPPGRDIKVKSAEMSTRKYCISNSLTPLSV